MRVSQTIDRYISNEMRRTNQEERAKHVPSGKLSASSLGKPTQWQVLHTLGVPGKEVEDYTLRVFKRGKDVEDWVVKMMPGLVGEQVEVDYKGVIGYIDTLIDTKDYDFKVGVIPNEIKSVKNSKFARIMQEGKPDRSHSLQATLYALARGTKDAMITYIAADDLRTHSFLISVSDYQEEVERIISDYDKAIREGTVPAFVAPEKWMTNPQYCEYPEWMSLTVLEALERLKTLHPESYQKLKQRSSTN